MYKIFALIFKALNHPIFKGVKVQQYRDKNTMQSGRKLRVKWLAYASFELVYAIPGELLYVMGEKVVL